MIKSKIKLMKRAIKYFLGVSAFLFLTFFCCSRGVYAYSNSISFWDYDYKTYQVVQLVGYNLTHGFSRQVPCSIRRGGPFSEWWYVDYDLPDDGSTWILVGYAFGQNLGTFDGIPYFSTYFKPLSATVTVGGSFTGYSPKTATDAANAAKSSADTAASYAQTAASNAQNAYNAANSAATYAQNAQNAANAAKSSADTAASYAQTAASNTAYSGRSAAYWAYLAAQNAAPRIDRVQGLNGATCTTGSSFTVVISAAPSSGLQYRVTCNTFDSGWVSTNQVTISSGLVYGANTATVQVRNTAGNTAQASLTFFKL